MSAFLWWFWHSSSHSSNYNSFSAASPDMSLLKMANAMFILQACLFCFAFRILHMFGLFMLNGYFFRSVLVNFKFLLLNKKSKWQFVWNIFNMRTFFSKSIDSSKSIVGDFKECEEFSYAIKQFYHLGISQEIFINISTNPPFISNNINSN